MIDIYLSIEDDREGGFLFELQRLDVPPEQLARTLRELGESGVAQYDQHLTGSQLGIRKNP